MCKQERRNKKKKKKTKKLRIIKTSRHLFAFLNIRNNCNENNFNAQSGHLNIVSYFKM